MTTDEVIVVVCEVIVTVPSALSIVMCAGTSETVTVGGWSVTVVTVTVSGTRALTSNISRISAVNVTVAAASCGCKSSATIVINKLPPAAAETVSA